MNASYFFRLASLSLASFFVLNVAAGALLACISNRVVRFASRMPARSAARLLFALRIAPAALAIFLVTAFCVPSYLWWEPQAGSEKIGLLCSAAAAGAILLWSRSIARSWRAIAESRAYLRACLGAAERKQVAGATVLLVPAGRTTVLAGLFRPFVVVSRDVAGVLPAEQLEAAILHERSHATSRDNLKRLAILLAPGIFGLRTLEQAWRRFAEWAADDLAVSGDRRRSLALAEALIRVARLGSEPHTSALTTSLLGGDFSARIDRLLNGEPGKREYRWQPTAAAMLVITAAILRPSTLDLVHRVLERLMH